MPRAMPTMVHPGILKQLRTFFPQYCDIQRRTVTEDSYGQSVVTFVTDPILKAIPCYTAPTLTGRVTEVRRTDQTIVTNPLTILLGRYVYNVNEQDRVVIDTNYYNILRVELDSTKTLTQLTVEQVNSGVAS